MEVALRRERDPEEYRRVLASSLQEVDRLTQLAEDLLTLARSDAGVMQPRLQVTDLSARAAVVVKRIAPRAETKGIDLQVEALTPTEALVDTGLIDRLLWNLVENAIKFTPREGGSRSGWQRRRGR